MATLTARLPETGELYCFLIKFQWPRIGLAHCESTLCPLAAHNTALWFQWPRIGQAHCEMGRAGAGVGGWAFRFNGHASARLTVSDVLRAAVEPDRVQEFQWPRIGQAHCERLS